MQEIIPKNEYDSADNMLENILSQRVEDIELSDTILPLNDITDSNKVFKGKLSILFVDMRKSTDLTDELKSKKMVKIYRSFIRMVVQAIRYCDGQSRQFAGDGVLGVFQNSADIENPVTSCEKAVKAARYILTLIDYCLNPKLKKYLGDISIGCGVGISTGTVMITKIGMRGKEADDTAENEMGIVWVGKTTNYASRLCSLATPREIFIDEKTYNGLSSNKENWKKETRVKGIKLFSGYITSEYYLPLFDGAKIEPIMSTDTDETEAVFYKKIFDEAKERTLQLVNEMNNKSVDLSSKINALNKKEQALNNKEINLNKREQGIKNIELEKEYNAEFSLLETAKQKFTENQIRSFGKDFWLKLIKKLETINSQLRNNFGGYDYYCISEIYLALEMYWEYYISICGMVQKGFPLYEYEVSPILKNIYVRDNLIELLQKFVDSNEESEQRDRYLKILKDLEL